MKQMKMLKEQIMAQIQSQMTHVQDVDTKELGEAVDMVKDLAEAIYYCTITEAMEEKEKHPTREVAYYFDRRYPWEPYYNSERDMDRDRGRMYYDGSSSGNGGSSMGGGRSSSGGNNSRGGGTRGYMDDMRYPYMEKDWPIEMRDHREGKSPMSRRSYMESKEMHHDQAKKMQELEKYIQELGQDITEMIGDASPEEKQLLKTRIATLSTKIA